VFKYFLFSSLTVLAGVWLNSWFISIFDGKWYCFPSCTTVLIVAVSIAGALLSTGLSIAAQKTVESGEQQTTTVCKNKGE
jgi:hypothetical protein